MESCAVILLTTLWIIYICIFGNALRKVRTCKDERETFEIGIRRLVTLFVIQIIIFGVWIFSVTVIENLPFVFLLTIIMMILIIDTKLTIDLIDDGKLVSTTKYLYIYTFTSILLYWIWLYQNMVL